MVWDVQEFTSLSKFKRRVHLTYIEFHDDIGIIEDEAFLGNRSLMSVELLGVKIVKAYAFQNYYQMTEIVKLAFQRCHWLNDLNEDIERDKPIFNRGRAKK